MAEYAVTVDLWDTLITDVPGGVVGRRRHELRVRGAGDALRQAGEPVDENALTRAFDEGRRMIDIDHALGLDLAFHDRLRQILSLVDEDLPDRLPPNALHSVASGADEPFLRYPPVLIEGAVEALSAIRETGVAIALISNTGLTSPATYRLFLENSGLAAHLDVLTFSNEIASAKPSSHIFEATLSRLGIPAWAALHVGDSLLADIFGGSEAGMGAAWLSGNDAGKPAVLPDFVMGHIEELPRVVAEWLAARPGPPEPAHELPQALS